MRDDAGRRRRRSSADNEHWDLSRTVIITPHRQLALYLTPLLLPPLLSAALTLWASCFWSHARKRAMCSSPASTPPSISLPCNSGAAKRRASARVYHGCDSWCLLTPALSIPIGFMPSFHPAPSLPHSLTFFNSPPLPLSHTPLPRFPSSSPRAIPGNHASRLVRCVERRHLQLLQEGHEGRGRVAAQAQPRGWWWGGGDKVW